jgi:protease-4
MKNFLKIVLAVIVGSFLTYLIVFFIGLGLIGSMSKGDTPKVKANSVIKMTLSQPIPEKTDNVESGTFDFENTKTLGLKDYLKVIENAKTDDKIKGIYLELSEVNGGLATMQVLREAIEDFRASGKFVIAYSDQYSQKAYYLATAAEKVYVHPMGGVDFRGFGAEVQYIKGLFDKLGIKTNIFYAGKFKSATEPLRRTDMSEENRLQVRTFLESVYTQVLADMAKSRKSTPEKMRAHADSFVGRSADGALAAGLVDGLKYKDEIIDDMKSRLGIEADKDIEAISPADYFEGMKKDKNYSAKDKIAIVYAEGNITDGEEAEAQIAGDHYAGIIRKLRNDKNVKAIVLRINSGGGSALASEKIWRELTLAREAGKYVVATMGDVAASGGYYIACGASKIYAEPTTLTGSIGVFGIIPNVREFTNKTLGVTVDTVKTGKYSTFNPLYFDMSAEESAYIQEGVDTIYFRFKKRVADARKLSMAQVEEIAQGRIWVGTTALQNKLVDSLGGLNDAIAHAAKEAGLTKYKLEEFPEAEDKFERLIKKFTGQASLSNMLKQEAAPFVEYLEMLEYATETKGPQVRLPFNIKIY